MSKIKNNKKTDTVLCKLKECNESLLQYTKYPQCIDKKNIFTTLFNKEECLLALTKEVSCSYYSEVPIDIVEIKYIDCLFNGRWYIIDYTEFQIKKYGHGYSYKFLVNLVSEEHYTIMLDNNDYGRVWVLLPKYELLKSLEIIKNSI